MCGIFGGISIKDPQATLTLMGERLKHRGPDDKGFFIDGSLALGHRRLSIIDLKSGHQPMFSADKQQVIVYNGEIYNFKEIKEELLKKGHRFVTESDTEVIIHAYRQWGYDCLDRFNGMFAFALWDKTKERLWLVRDRLGKKPLYFMQVNGSFYFVSEAKAIWGLPFFNGHYDPRAIDQFLTYRYVPGERTFYKEIKKLKAGHWILVDKDAKICQVKEWWHVPKTRDQAPASRRKTCREYSEKFQDIFSSAVKLRLVSDVPLGLFLSSGIDSVSIAMEMAKVSRPEFFTIGFGDEADETSAAAQVAQELGGNHHVFTMEEEAFDLLPNAVEAMDEPYGDPIALPTYLLAAKAADHVKVILTGDGADEVLGGYIHQVFFRKAPADFPLFGRRVLGAAVQKLPERALNFLFHYPAGMGAAGKKRLKELLEVYPDSQKAYLSWASLFTETERQALYSADFAAGLSAEPDEFGEEMHAHFSRKDIGAFDKVLQWDLQTWFPEQTLMKLDRLAMANSIEGRCPYADYRLVEFFLKMPFAVFKVLCDNKRVVRDIYQPKHAAVPRKKKPFFLPMHKGFDRRLRTFQDEVFGSLEAAPDGWFRPEVVQRLHQQREQSPLLMDKQIMSLFVLLSWLQKHR